MEAGIGGACVGFAVCCRSSVLCYLWIKSERSSSGNGGGGLSTISVDLYDDKLSEIICSLITYLFVCLIFFVDNLLKCTADGQEVRCTGCCLQLVHPSLSLSLSPSSLAYPPLNSSQLFS